MEKNEIVLFETEDQEIKLNVPIEEETVWLTQAQMTELFDTTKQNISQHINNCFKEGELEKDLVVKDFLTTASDGKNYRTKYYNLDVIISVGYRVKSKRGVEFRRWANSVLKQYMLEGYAVNNKRLEALEKTVEIQSKMLSSPMCLEWKRKLAKQRELQQLFIRAYMGEMFILHYKKRLQTCYTL